MLEILKNWATEIVAVIALLQPWVIAAWRRFVRRGAVEIYPTGTIEIGYSGFGATIGLQGTLRARDRDLFICLIHLELVRERDQYRREFEWGLFRSFRVIVGRPQELALALPAGFMLITSQPFRYNIQFHDLDLQGDIRPLLEQLQQAWVQATAAPGGMVYDQFAMTPQHVGAYTEVNRRCYWEVGTYRLTLSVETARPDRHFEQTWSFELSQQDVNRLRLNPIVVLWEVCGQPVSQYYFVTARYV